MIALDDAWNSIREQASTLDSYRSRVATLLGSVTVGSGLIGAVGLNSGGVDLNAELVTLALVAFLIQFATSIAILYPWVFAFARSAAWLESRALDRSYTAPQLRQKLLRDAGKNWEDNRKQIKRIGKAFTVCVVAFAVAVISSIFSILVGR